MLERLRPFFEPLNLAAYAAWLAIGVELVLSAPVGTGLVQAPLLWPAVLSLHVGFLVAFALFQWKNPSLRQRRAALAAQFGIALVVLSLARYGAAPVLLVVAMAQLAHVAAPLAQALVFVVVNAVLYLVFRELWQTSAPLTVWLMYASFQLFAIMTSWYAVTAERSRDALMAANADLLATRSLLDASARDSERLRLSRELHDVAGHKLTALKLNLGALQRQTVLPDGAQLALCAQLADELLGDIRGVVQQMRLHDGVGLHEMILRLAAPFPRPRLHLDMDPGLRVPSLEQAEAVLRTVQEALTNAARHGGAANLWLALRAGDGKLCIDINDDGRAPGGELCFGNGLTGMRERLESVGGGVHAQRGERGGVCLAAWMPSAA